MAKIRTGKVSHLEFLAQLRQLLAKHRYTITPVFNRIAVYDDDGHTVCSFRRMEGRGPMELRQGTHGAEVRRRMNKKLCYVTADSDPKGD